MTTSSSSTLHDRLAGLAQQLPMVPPHVWDELKRAIGEVGALEAAHDVASPNPEPQLIGEDRAGFVHECAQRLIDTNTDESGEFTAQGTRTLWWFWRLRGQQLETDVLQGKIDEIKRLKRLLAEQEALLGKADEQCDRIIHTLKSTAGASS